jgi:hypothetical protein
MTTQDPTIAVASTSTPAISPTAASKPWRTGAFVLAGAARLITISALLSIDRPAATWAELLLAIAPAPVAAGAAFMPTPLARLATLAPAVVMIAGIAGAILHTGLFFAPALVLLVVGGLKLWRERA